MLNAWYELTVIPAIVLGCLTALGQSAFDLVVNGMFQCSISQAVFAFLFFLVVMTAEDIWKLAKDCWNALNELDNAFPY